jgi:hypothetical protein
MPATAHWSRADACSMSASLIGRLGSSAFRLSMNSSVDVADGLSLLFGLGTKALPLWDSKTRWNNLSGDLAELDSSYCNLILHRSQAAATSLVHRNSVLSTHTRCMITANRRASATIAFFIPRCLALHRPGLEPGPFCRTHQHALGRFVHYSAFSRILCRRPKRVPLNR